MKNQKGSAAVWVLIIVVVLVVAGGIYFYSKNSSAPVSTVKTTTVTSTTSNTEAPGITVTSPKASDILVDGQTYTISWNSANLGDQPLLIDLDKTVDSRLSMVKNIASGIPNTGNYSWTPDSSILSDQNYSIRVYTSDNIGTSVPVAGGSSEIFSIVNTTSSATSNATSSATIDQLSLTISTTIARAFITGAASNTQYVYINIHAGAPAKPNGMNWLGFEKVPVIDSNWSVPVSSEMLSAMSAFSPLTVQVGTDNSGSSLLTTGTLTVSK